jgi:hypothetical protein
MRSGTLLVFGTVALAGLAAGLATRHDSVETTGEGLDGWASLNPSLHRSDNPPPWALDPDKWDRARNALAPQWDDFEDPWAMVTYVYERMGGRIG